MTGLAGRLVLFFFFLCPFSQLCADAYLSVDDYQQLNAGHQRAWIAGVVDGLLLMSQGSNLSGRRWLLDCVRERTMDQLHQAFAEYIESNSDYGRYAAAGEFAMAMNESCPRTPF